MGFPAEATGSLLKAEAESDNDASVKQAAKNHATVFPFIGCILRNAEIRFKKYCPDHFRAGNAYEDLRNFIKNNANGIGTTIKIENGDHNQQHQAETDKIFYGFLHKTSLVFCPGFLDCRNDAFDDATENVFYLCHI